MALIPEPGSSSGAVPLGAVDLNLLEPLVALLEERSVSRAAARLHRSQPALSASLARLRRLFGDELLTRVGNHYELTPLAARLRQRCAVARSSLERVFQAGPAFEPATAVREFTFALSDYATLVLGGPVSAVLRERAPGIRLRFEHVSTDVVDHPADALRAIDGIVLPHGFLSDLPHLDLFTDTWVCVVDAGNPTVGDTLSMDDLERLPWVTNFHRPTAFTPASRQLQTIGLEPRIDVVVDGFLALPALVVGTDRIALVQHRLVDCLPMRARLRVLPCPFEPLPLVESLWWHPLHDDDPEHAWMREVFREVSIFLQ